MLNYKGFVGNVEFDEDTKVLFGRVVNTRDVITFQSIAANEIEKEFQESVDEYLDMCKETGKVPYIIHGKAFYENIIKITFQLPMQMVKKEQWYVASCSALDVHSQGDSQEHAKTNLIEALTLFLSSCLERGTLEAILKECGFHVCI